MGNMGVWSPGEEENKGEQICKGEVRALLLFYHGLYHGVIGNKITMNKAIGSFCRFYQLHLRRDEDDVLIFRHLVYIL